MSENLFDKILAGTAIVGMVWMGIMATFFTWTDAVWPVLSQWSWQPNQVFVLSSWFFLGVIFYILLAFCCHMILRGYKSTL